MARRAAGSGTAVETAITGLAHQPTKLKSLEFDLLFRFVDVGNSGVSRWIALHRGHPRIVQPVLRLLELREATLETHVAQLGMGLEALGLKVTLDSKVAKKKAEQERSVWVVGATWPRSIRLMSACVTPESSARSVCRSLRALRAP